MTERSPTSFVMHAARTAMEAGLRHIEEQVRGIEQAVSENPGLAFDLAKSLIESVCRTILTERGVAFNPGDDLPKLFKTASQHLPFLPTVASAEHELRKSLNKTLSGLSTAILGVCELRNACGFASHGSDRPRLPMEAVQALLAAEAADAIVGFLHRVHCQDRTPPPSPRAEYEQNVAFNDYVDDTNGPIRIFEVEFRPSEVLFQIEPETYRIYLVEYTPDSAAGDEATSGVEQKEVEL